MKPAPVAATWIALTFSTALSLGQTPPTSNAFCKSVLALVQASYSDFRGIKRNAVRNSEGFVDWVPSITIAGASDCTGQTLPSAETSVSCKGAESESLEDLDRIYTNAVAQLKSCLPSSFEFSETHGGKSHALSTPIKEATFEIKGKDEEPDGPSVRVTLDQWHSSRKTDYEITIWVDGKGKY